MNKINFNAPLAIGLVGAGLLATGAPAQAVAVQYVFQNATLTPSAPLTGSFFFDPSPSPTYSNWSVTVGAESPFSAFTYTPSNSVFTSSFTFPFPPPNGTTVNSSASTLILTAGARQLYLTFGQALTGTVGQTSTITPGAFASFETDGSNTRSVLSGTGASVTGVPLETDALPVAATMAVVGGMLWYRNRKRSWVALDLTPSAQTQKV